VTVTGSLSLSPLAAAQLGRGVADLPLALVPAPPPAGSPVTLLAPSGEALALGIVDDENGCIRIMSGAGQARGDLDERYWAARVARALTLREQFGISAVTDAYRVINGAGDGLPGFVAERFGRWAVVWVPATALLPFGRALADAIRQATEVDGVVVKVRARGAGPGRPVQDIVGLTPPSAVVVEERALRAEVHLLSGTNVGLFTDMREHRHALGALVHGRRVLNGFSYTGTLSVAAARAGAAAVTSVDVSAGVQRWARDNFRHNGLDPDAAAHRFETDDTARFVRRARDAGELFDVLLLDPPSYSAARDAGFAIERDYPDLIARAAALVSSNGWLWLACNTRHVSLIALAQQGLLSAARDAQLASLGGLPPDYPTRPGDDTARYLQVAVYRLA
jgi:23S rRNA (cytosine1962-C5)-methyltransferase